MDIKNLTDKSLLAITAKLAGQERQLVTVILRHLAEIQRRRLFCEVGCSSLFAYCTDMLKYSEAQAHQKIQAMRAMLEVPELEKKIEKGKISLTNVAQAQSFFRQEAKATKAPLPVAKKKEIFKKLERTSTREGQRILLSLSSQPKTLVAEAVEKVRTVTPEITEVRFAANDELLAKLKKLKGLMAHKNANMNYSDLINELCEIGLNKLDPVRKAERAERRRREKMAKGASGSHPHMTSSDQSARTTHSSLGDQSDQTHPYTLGDPRSGARKRGVAAAVRHRIWQRAKGACENCGSRHALQLDHIKPYAFGGDANLENIRLLCRACNQRAAIGSLGISKMMPFINGLRQGQ